MNTTKSIIDIDKIERFLTSRDWKLQVGKNAFNAYIPPIKLELPNDFKLSIPKIIKNNDDSNILKKAIISIASIYNYSESEIDVLLEAKYDLISIAKGDACFWSTRLIGVDTDFGSVSLSIFDNLMSELRKLLLDAAAFAVTKSPRLDIRPPEAQSFYESCRFLQTQKGSFITNLEIPPLIIQQKGFDREEVTANGITEIMFDVLEFVNNSVLLGDQSIFTEDFLIKKPEFISYEVLHDIEQVYIKTEAEEIEFSYKTFDTVKSTTTGHLTDIKIQDLTNFVKFVKENTSTEFPIDARGSVIELRSADPGGDKNYVLITRSYNRTEDLAMYLNSEQYKEAAIAHTTGKLIHITGMATQLKTKSRMTQITSFEVTRS